MSPHHCIRCGGDLTAREITTGHIHCEPCRKVLADAAYTERLSRDLARANGRVRA